jgi:hypothetical protein
MAVGGQRCFTPQQRDPAPIFRRLGGPRGRSGRVWKMSPGMGFDPCTIQLLTGVYSDWATRNTYRADNILISAKGSNDA